MSSKVQKRCRTCGELYTPCPDCENDRNIFRWRTVACSRECGMKYLKAIEDSRKLRKTINGKMPKDVSKPSFDCNPDEKNSEKLEKHPKRNSIKK